MDAGNIDVEHRVNKQKEGSTLHLNEEHKIFRLAEWKHEYFKESTLFKLI